jgi:type I restriction enzyme M protein
MKTVVANPPFSAVWNANMNLLEDDRFRDYGKLAPKSKADYAFVLDMVHQLEKDGVMAVVLPHGVLFRGSSEGHIRKHLICDKNYLDAVIGLPPNIFFGTSIPTCILIFRKDRKHDECIIFIDASREFEKKKNKNLLTDENIKKITETYHTKKAIDKYSYLATIREISENDFNLNIPRYVDTFESEPEIDIQTIMKDIEDLEVKRQSLDVEIDEYFKELGLK